ncbi:MULTISPECIES: GNAT family N-acetyltransferase [Streptomyces]|uniref:GNAT family N-acetyltransferase n=1 Tax=Streptomyces TaxID=1883 RepID=UPI001966344E|nr:MULTISPECIES: GNAT family N-acetyltransferase [Streptomyces]QRX92572.1 GNAT family N-acetyltransferase [Streptomyces noursei]UJB42294.1 GNAT family N-acetyltransferase [Streptomyces sp. A1-5]
MKPVTLTTDRLLLRPFEPSDVPAVHTACQDPAIPRWTAVPTPYGLDDAERFVGTAVPEGWRNDTAYTFAVATRDGGTLVGSMGLVRLDRLRTVERQAELGYWTAKEHRGKGYTAEAAGAVVRWAFRELGVERMEWLAEAGNEGSWAVARKVGFRREGTLRAKLVHGDIRRDLWIGSLLPSDLPREPAPAGCATAPAQDPTPYLPHPR